MVKKILLGAGGVAVLGGLFYWIGTHPATTEKPTPVDHPAPAPVTNTPDKPLSKPSSEPKKTPPSSKTQTPVVQTETAPTNRLDPQEIEARIEKGELAVETDAKGTPRQFFSPSGRYTVSVVVPTREDEARHNTLLPPAVPVISSVRLPDGEKVPFSILHSDRQKDAIVKIVDEESGEVTYEPLEQVEQQNALEESEDKKILPPPSIPTF